MYTLPATNGSPLKMDGLEDDISFWDGPISGAFAVSFREGTGCFIGILVMVFTGGSHVIVYDFIPKKNLNN